MNRVRDGEYTIRVSEKINNLGVLGDFVSRFCWGLRRELQHVPTNFDKGS